MPIGDNTTYEVGHFTRVYEYLIKPAVMKAGFEAIRSDDLKHSDLIMVDILNNLYDCEMALCDLSSKNANVMYELGIRHSFNLPVALIKDDVTNRVFDIQGLRAVDYKSSLRVDDVEIEIERIAETIKQTYNRKDDESNSVLKILEIQPAKITNHTEISNDTQLILASIKSLNERINDFEDNHSSKSTSSIDDFVNELFKDKYKPGTKVEHRDFGIGKVITTNGRVITIAFNKKGIKKLDLIIAEKLLRGVTDDEEVSTDEVN
jgi:hypothetical protein